VALIYSYEQGLQDNGDMGRIGIQLMGPDDSYIAQTSTDISAFWADRHRMRLGACLKQAPARSHGIVPKKPMPEVRIHLVGDGYVKSGATHIIEARVLGTM
jgi:hypothetical protein